MRDRILELIRHYTRAALLSGGLALATSSLTLAADDNAPQTSPNGSDEIYRQAGARLQQHNAQHRLVAMPQAPAPPADNAAPQRVELPAAPVEAAPPAVKTDEPWSIMSAFDDECGGNWLKDGGLTVGGWIQVGYQNNPDGAFTGNGPFLDDHDWDNVNLNQSYLFVERLADGTKGLDWGFRTDIIYGVDAYNTQAIGGIDNTGTIQKTGWDSEPSWRHGPYGWTIPQLYGEVAMDNVSVKLGHMYAIVGYESTPATANFFLSHNITFYNSEPFTYTGALATWKASDQVTFVGGWALGFDTGFYQFQGGNMGIFGVAYNLTDKTSLSYAGNYGNLGWRGMGAINGFILSHKWTDKLQSVHQLDVLSTNNGTSFGGPAATGITGDSVGQINYLFYEVNDKFKLGARQEWYKADGISYNVVTYGVNIMPNKNLIIRPEMRHMFANTADGPDLQGNIHQVYGGNDVFGVDVIFKF